MEKDIVIILEDIQKKVEKYDVFESKRGKLIPEINSLIESYRNVEVSDEYKEVYDSMIKKGKELLNSGAIKGVKTTEYYLRYCHAALYDFKGDVKTLNKILFPFMITSSLFLLLSPQYFSYVLPLMMFLPIFFGIKGMKKRSINGLRMGMAVMPMALLVSVIWLKSALLATKDYKEYVSSIAQQYQWSIGVASNVTIIFTILSGIMFISCIYTIYLGYKHRKMFV